MNRLPRFKVRELFIIQQVIIAIFTIIVWALFATYVWHQEKINLKQSLAMIVDRDSERLNAEFRNAEVNVLKLKQLAELTDIMPKKLRFKKFQEVATNTIGPYPNQYNAYIAIKSEDFIHVVRRNSALLLDDRYNDPKSFRTEIFKNSAFFNGTQPWWNANLNNSTVNHSDFYFDRDYMGRVMFSTTTGIHKNGQLEIVVGIDTLAGDLNRIVSGMRFGEGGAALLTDSKGYVLPQLQSQNYSIIQYIKNKKVGTEASATQTNRQFAVEEPSALSEFKGDDGITYITMSKALKYRPWNLVIFQKKQEAFKGIHRKVFYISVIIIGLYIIFAAVSTFCNVFIANRFIDLKKQIQDLGKKLALASGYKRVFLAMMSYEIKGPLGNLLGNVEILGESESSLKRAEVLEKVKKSAEILSTHLNNAFDLANLDTGIHLAQEKEFLLSELVYDVEIYVKPIAELAGVNVVFTTHDIEQVVKGYPERIKQILLNFVLNAINASLRGKAEVDVSRVVDPATYESKFVFKVKDTSFGIPMDIQESIRYNSLFSNPAEFTDSDIVNLSLMLSRQLLTQLGGNLTLQSTLGVGTEYCFEFKMPIRSVIAESTQLMFVEMQALLEIQDRLKQIQDYKILIVESDKDFQLVVNNYLSELTNFNITVKDNGFEALEEIDVRQIDMFIISLKMPHLSSQKFLRIIRSNPRYLKTPVIVMTVQNTESELKNILNLGATAYLVKPFSKKELLTAIAGQIDK